MNDMFRMLENVRLVSLIGENGQFTATYVEKHMVESRLAHGFFQGSLVEV